MSGFIRFETCTPCNLHNVSPDGHDLGAKNSARGEMPDQEMIRMLTPHDDRWLGFINAIG